MNLHIYLLCIISLLSLSNCGESHGQEQKPNFLFILADDLGYHDLSCMGSDYYETPNIDRIAQGGMVFTNGYAACQVCSPSRAAIMTGKAPARLGITDWIGAKTGRAWREHNRHDKLLPAKNGDHLPHAEITLAEVLKDKGYKTFFAGKWHIGGEGSYPEDHGFEINKGGWEKGSPIGGFFSPWENPKLPNLVAGESLPMRLGHETAAFIEENQASPFFAFLSFYAVHGPIQTTKEKWKKYRDKAEQQGLAELGFVMERHLPIRQTQDNPVYAGLVESMDDAVGIVLDKLSALGLEENTVVIFTSDNGGVASGDSYSTSNLPLRGGKGYQWEGGVKEPYFIKVPWLESAVGGNNDAPVIGMDFYPTILELAGMDLMTDQHRDGISLLPVLKGEALQSRPLFWHYPHYGNQGGDPSAMVRDGAWKLIHYWEDGHNELYHLKDDPGEQMDLAPSHRDKTDQLFALLNNWLQETGALRPSPDPEYNAQLDQEHHQRMVDERWPALEAQRKAMLSLDFDPGNRWWGSDVDN